MAGVKNTGSQGFWIGSVSRAQATSAPYAGNELTGGQVKQSRTSMIDLHKLANTPGWGKAHSQLCREGHPTERPRSEGLIEYRVDLEGPRGDRVVLEVMAESVSDAVTQAKNSAWHFDLLEIDPYVDEDDDIQVVSVSAFD